MRRAFRWLLPAVALLFVPRVASADQFLQWVDYCTTGSFSACASVEVTLSPQANGTTNVSIRMRNLEGTLGNVPWRMTNVSFNNLMTDAVAGGLGLSVFPPPAMLEGTAGYFLNVDPSLCRAIVLADCPTANFGLTEWDLAANGSDRASFYYSQFSGGPWLPDIIGCDSPATPSSGLASFQTCGEGWVDISFTLQGNWVFDENSSVTWYGTSDQGTVQCVVGENCVGSHFHTTTSTPEPGTLALMATGLLALGAKSRRRWLTPQPRAFRSS